ncbi:hypothetical protein, partial [Helicobacter pylori]|uniref:hypothetical protein n=1 Tax=Helicobacter pylori TaxID=210 RepID=UPI001E3E342E
KAFSYLVAFSLISSLACLTPLLSSSMILSVLLLKCDFCALNSLTRFLASDTKKLFLRVQLL